jgi:signal transduction histidine kinase
MNETQHRQLLSVGRDLLQELDTEEVLHRVLEVAREVTGARYAALGVLDDQGRHLRRFIVDGIDAETRQRIGDLPHGRGVLGELIRDPRPLRLASVGDHPRSYGFPPNHPPMTTFLGVPVMIRGEAFGNLYLTEKAGGEFDADDEEALVVLAEWAAVAIENARLHERLSDRRDELERAVETLSATTSIARALAGETDLGRILELIAKRGRAVIDARTLLILLLDGDQVVVAAGAGALPHGIGDTRIPLEHSITGQVLESGRSQRLTDIERARFEQSGLGALGLDPECGLLVPLLFRQTPIGMLAALDRDGPGDFTEDHRHLLEAFAVSAATAVGTAQAVTAQQRRRGLQATEAERRRWARELHDDSLQELAAIRLRMASDMRHTTVDALREAMQRAIEELDERIAALRALISDLRPAALDQLGLESALEDLVDRLAARGMDVRLQVDMGEGRMDPELEDTLYRLTQEALNNVLKHAGTNRADVSVVERAGRVALTVRDEGRGFGRREAADGFGLAGMRERTALLDGRFDLRSSPGEGTSITVELPVRHRAGDRRGPPRASTVA